MMSSYRKCIVRCDLMRENSVGWAYTATATPSRASSWESRAILATSQVILVDSVFFTCTERQFDLIKAMAAKGEEYNDKGSPESF